MTSEYTRVAHTIQKFEKTKSRLSCIYCKCYPVYMLKETYVFEQYITKYFYLADFETEAEATNFAENFEDSYLYNFVVLLGVQKNGIGQILSRDGRDISNDSQYFNEPKSKVLLEDHQQRFGKRIWVETGMISMGDDRYRATAQTRPRKKPDDWKDEYNDGKIEILWDFSYQH